MKLKVSVGEDPKKDEKPKDELPKRKRLRFKDDKETKTQYGLYSGIIGDKGSQDNPKDSEAIKNMVQYMKNNNPPESDNPSNVYRPKFSHMAVNYDRKKKMANA